MSLLGRLESLARPQAATQATQSLPKFSPSFITEVVFASDDIPQESRVSSEYIHVSSLIEFCVRRQVLSVKDNINLTYQPRGQDRVVWAMGRAAEHHVRTQLIKRFNYVGVVGEWECKCGGVKYSGVHDHSIICGRCGESATTYHEFTVVDYDYKIIGNPDFLFFYELKLIVLEIKSMNKKEFELLTSPFPDHIFQAGAYRKILAKRGTVEILPEVIILYVVKDYIYRGLPYKEYHVDVTKAPWDNILNIAWENAASVKSSNQSNTIPPRLSACPTPNSPMAKRCAAVVSCFSRR